MEKLLMALDAGTTSNRCILFNKKGSIVKMQQREFTQYFPKPGWVEHDAEEIWLSMYSVASEALANAGATAEEVAAIGITNQRETVIMWDRKTGDPIYRAIVWQDRRTADYCQELKEKGLEEFFKSRTGLLIDPYFSGTKVRWILENVEGIREKAERGEIAFGTVETWLIWKLTGGKVHITDYSNASRTLLFNIFKLEWDQEILDLFGIPASILPEVRPSSEVYGETAYSRFNGCIPIAGAAGDQQAALFGQTCFKPGECKNTYGTGCFLLMNTGQEPVEGKNGLLTTIAWGINGHVTYALEGSVFIGGAVIKWLVEELKILDSSSDSEYFARKVPDTNGCYIVPAFTGLGAPYWDPYARGVVVGLTRGVNRYHLIRAAEESIAYQSNDLLELMTKNSGIPVTSLKVDGGATRDNLLLQFQSDISDVPVTRPENVETTALGAAYLAGLAVGYYDSPDEVLRNWRFGEVFKPSMQEEERQKKLRGWHKAVERAKDWARDEE